MKIMTDYISNGICCEPFFLKNAPDNEYKFGCYEAMQKDAEMITKPKPKRGKPYWDYFEVSSYIENISGKKLRDWEGHDFWLWMLDMNQIHNGCYFYLNIDLELKENENKLWICEILSLIKKEFNVTEMRFWVEW